MTTSLLFPELAPAPGFDFPEPLSDKYRPRTGALRQTVTSGGLWGIESDSDESYLKEVEGEELSQLREELGAMGFSKRAIATAIKQMN